MPMTTDGPRNHDGPRPRCSLDMRSAAYPKDMPLGERDETALLLDAAMDDADPDDGDIDAWLRHRHGALN